MKKCDRCYLYKKIQIIYNKGVIKEVSKIEIEIMGCTKPDSPLYYGGSDSPTECIKVIEAWGLGFNLGNVLKYICRAGLKDGRLVEDLKKAKYYIEREIYLQSK